MEKAVQEQKNCINSVKRLANNFDSAIPQQNADDPNGQYTSSKNWSWVNAFYPGQLWLAFEQTNDLECKRVAQSTGPHFEHLLEAKNVQHDIGFLYGTMYAQGYELTQDQDMYARATNGAQFLIDRFIPSRRVIPSWTFEPGSAQEGKIIIDSIMNLKLLWWSDIAEANSVATAHAQQIARYMIRPDGSTFHVFYFDPDGKPLHGETLQGLSDDSCLSRGQAWAVNGFTAAYNSTGEPEFLEAAIRTADYAIAHAQPDFVPVWDYMAKDDTYRDSSAAAILADGLLDLAEATDNTAYRDHAVHLLDNLITHYSCAEDEEKDGLLLHGCEGVKGPVFDGQLPYGDYFYLKALTKAANLPTLAVI